MYEVGQVLYVLMKKEHTVIPVRVVEKILRKTLDGESISYIVELPTSSQDHVDLEKLGTGIYSSSADAMSVMIDNAKATISGIIKKAENIAKTAFNVDTQPPDVPQQVEVLAHDLTPQNTEAHFNLGEQMEVDLGQGLKGKINISGLET
tara:strand:- start:1146 stop:1592 length:447 start_codon:yes stop_codon:yes gene_type:complete